MVTKSYKIFKSNTDRVPSKELSMLSTNIYKKIKNIYKCAFAAFVVRLFVEQNNNLPRMFFVSVA